VLEARQLATDTKLGTMESSVARIDNSLAALLRCFDDLMTREHDRHHGHNNNNNNNYDEHVNDNWDEYSADSELDDHDAHRPVQHNHHGRDGHRRHEVCNNDDAFHKLKFKMPPFDGKYDPDAYISWELAVEQKFTCFEFPENARFRAATSEFSDLPVRKTPTIIFVFLLSNHFIYIHCSTSTAGNDETIVGYN
jgi:hypothetical protein